jgi:hypothetical protein
MPDVSLLRLTSHIVKRLCAGGEIAFRLPVTAAQFIDKSSLFILSLGIVRHAGTKADSST